MHCTQGCNQLPHLGWKRLGALQVEVAGHLCQDNLVPVLQERSIGHHGAVDQRDIRRNNVGLVEHVLVPGTRVKDYRGGGIIGRWCLLLVVWYSGSTANVAKFGTVETAKEGREAYSLGLKTCLTAKKGGVICVLDYDEELLFLVSSLVRRSLQGAHDLPL